tara:strand:- start:982 stop:1803 length:822 start_codon:yes stop_codon:yes gene_type:complete
VTKKKRSYFILFTLVLVFLGIMIANIPALKSYIILLEKEREDRRPQMLEISQRLSRTEAATVRRSYENAVGIVSMSPSVGVSSFSGTLFKHKNKFYVISVAHGLVGTCESTFVIIMTNDVVPCGKIVIVDHKKDYSIIELKNMPEHDISPTGVSLSRILFTSERQWNRAVGLQNKIYYTGFPNGTGPLTISGEIIGFQEDKYIFVHSYAWSGASGSGIFSSNGKFLGVLLAVEVGSTNFGVQILENVVIILPETSIDWSVLDNREQNGTEANR